MSKKKFSLARFLTSILMWVTAAAILAFAVLWLVPNAANPRANAIADPGSYQVIRSGGYSLISESSGGQTTSYSKDDPDPVIKAKAAGIYDAFIKSIKYPMAYGIMENSWFKGFKITTEKVVNDDNEEEEVLKEFYREDFGNITGSKNTPLIAFRYGLKDEDKQTFKYKETEIKYNLILFTTEDANFGQYKIYFVDTVRMSDSEDEDYFIWEFTGYAKLAQTWESIQE